MLNNWFYAHGPGVVTLAVCAAVLLTSLAGLAASYRLVDRPARQRDNAMIGRSYALVGGIYAVLIAFVALGVFQAMDRSQAVATEEANALSDLAFESAGLPGALGPRVRTDLGGYVDIVTGQEWPWQRAHEMAAANFAEGWAQLKRVNLEVAGFDPSTPGQATVKSQMVHGINDLFAARRTRIAAASAHLPTSLWLVMLCGAALVAVYLCLFGPTSFRLHMIVTGLTMLCIGLMFSLIIGLDYPFRGPSGVGDDTYLYARATVDRIFAQTEQGK